MLLVKCSSESLRQSGSDKQTVIHAVNWLPSTASRLAKQNSIGDPAGTRRRPDGSDAILWTQTHGNVLLAFARAARRQILRADQQQALDNPKTKWTKVEIDRWYGGQKREVEIHTELPSGTAAGTYRP